MAVSSGASKVTVRNVPPTLPGLPSSPLDVLRIAGITEWGPEGVATVSVDYDDWFLKFGGFLSGYMTPISVREFFAGGGRQVVTVRITKYNAGATTAVKASKVFQTDTTAATAGEVTGSIVGPFALVAGDTLIGNVDAVGEQTLTIAATAAARENTPAETYALTTGQVLTVKVNQEAVAQSIAFLTAEFVNIAAATAEEVAAVINAKIVGARATVTSGGTKVTITSDRKGTKSYIEVTGGTANTVLTFATAEVQGTGNVENVSSVTVTELKTLLEATWTNSGGVTVSSSGGMIKIVSDTTGAASSIQVAAASTGDDELGLDNAVHSGGTGVAQNTLKLWGKYYGTKGNSLTATVETASNGEAARFDVRVYLSGIQQELWRNLTMDTADANYAETIINAETGGSRWITADDQTATGTTLQRRPVTISATALTGGGDGLAGLADADFIGTAGYGNGFFAFDTKPDDGDILICPDTTAVAVQNAATAMCETNWKGKVVFIPDPPAASSYSGIVTQAQNLTASESRTGIIWPRVLIPNPDKAIYGADDVITICPSGPWAARMALNSKLYEESVWKQPSNERYGLLTNVTDVERDEVQKETVREYVTPYLVNPIIKGKTLDGSFGVWVNDCQSGKSTGNWRSVGEIRGVAKVAKDVSAFAEVERTQGNNEDSRRRQALALEGYMIKWCVKGAFASRNASLAFYVNTDPEGLTLNNALEQEAQRLNWLIGIATAQPGRFVEVGITRDQRAVMVLIQKLVSAA